MIIIIGPDASGKTRLAQDLACIKNRGFNHFDMNTTYMEYLLPLAELQWVDAVLDRFILCEYVYAPLKRREILYSPKEFHNILMLALIQRPVIILTTHIPPESEYEKDQYLGWEHLGGALSMYRRLLRVMRIPFQEYDYEGDIPIDAIIKVESLQRSLTEWWTPMWRARYGCIGSPEPKVVIVAERLGPYNYRYLPFEAGPTGLMMTELMGSIPLWDYTLTNWMKTGDKDKNEVLLREELLNLSPEHVILMGSIANSGCRGIVKSLGIECTHIPHLGYVNRNRHMWPHYKESFRKMWEKIVGGTG